MASRTLALVAFVALALAANPAAAESAGKCGGNGGNRTATLTCPPGYHIIGLSARGGAFIDQIGVRCGLAGRGTTTSVGRWMTAGGTGGTQFRSGRCPNRGRVKAIAMRSAAVIDRMVFFECTSVSDISLGSVVSLRVGGMAGGNCSLRCTGGRALYWLRIKYGAVIDSVAGGCR